MIQLVQYYPDDPMVFVFCDDQSLEQCSKLGMNRMEIRCYDQPELILACLHNVELPDRFHHYFKIINTNYFQQSLSSILLIYSTHRQMRDSILMPFAFRKYVASVLKGRSTLVQLITGKT